jgi:hypothetical protein
MKELISKAWDEAVTAYLNSHVNSERTLQASIYASLLRQLPEGHRVLCEPCIDLQGQGRFIPDMVVLSQNQIEAAIELKFVPHHYPTMEDFEKLKKYSLAADEFPLLLSPTTGRYDDTKFKFSPDCLLAFAVIGQHNAIALDRSAIEADMAEHRARFLFLSHPVGGNS